MRIVYPYNEILPKRKAHDVFIFHECAALADLGWDLSLLVGKGSEKNDLLTHYQVPFSTHFQIKPRFIVRKNNPLGITWNFPFFLSCQRYIHKHRPDWVFLSVRKQGAYHLAHKVLGVRYLYEVHELLYYPHQNVDSSAWQLEKTLLERADLITVTTSVLKDILVKQPYALKVPIEVIPLAVQAKTLPPPPSEGPLQLMYVGQLYAEQGIKTLLTALTHVQDVHLKILGGTYQEMDRLSQFAKELAISTKVEFLGFIPPYQIPSIAQKAHAFVAPFENRGRMPYVAHTKLYEYAEWGRPLIAPRLPIVEEHFQKGALLFEPDNAASLAQCIQALQQKPLLTQLQNEISSYSGRFSWTSRASHYARLLSDIVLE